MVTYITLSSTFQKTMLGVAALAAVGVGYLSYPSSVDPVVPSEITAAATAEPASAEEEAVDTVSALQLQLAESRRSIDQLQSKLGQAGVENESIRGSLDTANQDMHDLREQRDRLTSARDSLLFRVRASEEAELRAAARGAATLADAGPAAGQSTPGQPISGQLATNAAATDTVPKAADGTASPPVVAAVPAADPVDDQLKQIVAEREKLAAERDKVAAERDALKADRDKLKSKVVDLEERNVAADAVKSSAVRMVANERDKVSVERDRAATERDKLKARVAELEQKLQKVLAMRDDSTSAVADATDKAADKAAQKHASADVGEDGKLADVLMPMVAGASAKMVVAGVDIERLLSSLIRPEGKVGGPFVALNPASAGDQATQNETVQRLLKTIPFTAPLDKFQVESKFGPRVDPFNGRQAIHTGVDLSGPYQTPIFNTSPGTVVFAGFQAGYGKLVEIDHGMGISTKYGHLNRITVNVGQKLSKKTQIGLLGSTGRSTGPHVHYEVLVNGVPQDPEKFMLAGKSVVQVQSN
ncbi:MAG TPA: peptidoglycan DD-metalloendopeptidase family protein [Stellaceae bacterium]|nr:peptidoglycan DD-metalloendopeptidase family protein [Stellaceae bacterium]